MIYLMLDVQKLKESPDLSGIRRMDTHGDATVLVDSIQHGCVNILNGVGGCGYRIWISKMMYPRQAITLT